MKLTEPQALNRAASYCSKAERCEFDVIKKLTAWEQSEEAIARIMKRLKDERFLSDERFCKSFIRDKMQFNKWGKAKIVYELKKRKISSAIYTSILEELDNSDFEKQLLHILRIKARSIKAKDHYDKKNKLIRFALGRGFSMDLTIKCVDKIINMTDEEIME